MEARHLTTPHQRLRLVLPDSNKSLIDVGNFVSTETITLYRHPGMTTSFPRDSAFRELSTTSSAVIQKDEEANACLSTPMMSWNPEYVYPGQRA
jgi:hypothetical protein